jgi:hypothetical protein
MNTSSHKNKKGGIAARRVISPFSDCSIAVCVVAAENKSAILNLLLETGYPD